MSKVVLSARLGIITAGLVGSYIAVPQAPERPDVIFVL